MIKAIIGILLLAVIVSLFSSLFFLVKDHSKSKRTVNALTVRVGLAAALLLVIIIASQSGELQLNPSPINAF